MAGNLIVFFEKELDKQQLRLISLLYGSTHVTNYGRYHVLAGTEDELIAINRLIKDRSWNGIFSRLPDDLRKGMGVRDAVEFNDKLTEICEHIIKMDTAITVYVLPGENDSPVHVHSLIENMRFLVEDEGGKLITG